MAGSITQGTRSVGFSYDDQHQRLQQTLNVNGSIATTTDLLPESWTV